MISQRKILLSLGVLVTLVLSGFLLYTTNFFSQEEGRVNDLVGTKEEVQVEGQELSSEFVLPTEICYDGGADCYSFIDEQSSLTASALVRFRERGPEQHLLLGSQLYDENVNDTFISEGRRLLPVKALAIEVFSYSRKNGMTLTESLAVPERGSGISFERPIDLNDNGFNEVVYRVLFGNHVLEPIIKHGLLVMNFDGSFRVLPAPSANDVVFWVDGKEQSFVKDTGEVGFASKFYFDESKTQNYLTISAMLEDRHSESSRADISQTLGRVYYELDEEYTFHQVYYSTCDLTSMSESDCSRRDKAFLVL